MLAIPITIGQISQMLMGLVDSVMIGRTGTVPLAASAFGGGVFNVFFIVGVGMLTPVAVFASRARGAGRHPEAGEYLRHGLVLALAAGVAEVSLMVLIGRHLNWFGQPPEVIAAVNPFFYLIGASLLPVLAYLALRQFAESMGRPWVPVIVVLASVALNIFLNWVFIYGNLGSPPLGLAGAGIATLLARILSSAVIYVWLRFDPAMREAWPRRWFAPISWGRLMKMLSIGLPTSVSLAFETGAFAMATVMMGWLGAVPLAAHQIALSCAAMTFMIPLGISIALGMRLSAAVGAGEHDRLRPMWVGAAAAGAALSVAFTAFFLRFGRDVATLFVVDPGVVSLATVLIVIAAVFQFFDGGQVIHSGALRALTDVKVPTVITFVAYWVIALPIAYALCFHTSLGPSGIWLGLALGLAAASTLLAYRFFALTRA